MDFSRFDYGALHEDQRARLGIGITDINGERWGYGPGMCGAEVWGSRSFERTQGFGNDRTPAQFLRRHRLVATGCRQTTAFSYQVLPRIYEARSAISRKERAPVNSSTF